jgi:hypothetical protein
VPQPTTLLLNIVHCNPSARAGVAIVPIDIWVDDGGKQPVFVGALIIL